MFSHKLGNLKPTQPGNFAASSDINARSITVRWAASSDDGSISKYEVKIGSGSWVSTQSLSHTFTGLTVETNYSFQVRAKDDENTYSDIASMSSIIQNIPSTPVISWVRSWTENVTWTDSTCVISCNVTYEVRAGYPRYYQNSTDLGNTAWDSVGTSTSYTHHAGPSGATRTFCLEVRATNTSNGRSNVGRICKTMYRS